LVKNVRALGVRVTDLVESDTCTQISLFSDDIKGKSLRYLMSVWTGQGEIWILFVRRGILLQDRGLNRI